MGNKINDLLNCDCDVCEYRRYININDCDIRRKKAIKSALYKAIKERLNKISHLTIGGRKSDFIRKMSVLSAIKEIFNAK